MKSWNNHFPKWKYFWNFRFNRRYNFDFWRENSNVTPSEATFFGNFEMRAIWYYRLASLQKISQINIYLGSINCSIAHDPHAMLEMQKERKGFSLIHALILRIWYRPKNFHSLVTVDHVQPLWFIVNVNAESRSIYPPKREP